MILLIYFIENLNFLVDGCLSCLREVEIDLYKYYLWVIVVLGKF